MIKRVIGVLLVTVLAGCDHQFAVDRNVPVPPLRPHMQWWREARFGMFVHYGAYSSMHIETGRKLRNRVRSGEITGRQYRRLVTEELTPTPDFAEQWVLTAKGAGMKYIVLTAKHGGGFCLWDSKTNPYNSVNLGPKRDLVAELAAACRKHGIKLGVYYSIADNTCPDSRRAAWDADARLRFIAYQRSLLRELMTQYGQISILWYDQPHPLGMGDELDSEATNAMVRRLQPGIVINDRSMTYQDFTCPERSISPTLYPDQDWEACMPINPHWAWYPAPEEKYLTARQIIDMLQKCTAGTGNLLLNVGPKPKGAAIGEIEKQRLATVGRWLKRHGEAVYGRVSRVEALAGIANDAGGKWTRKGNTAYLWLPQWPQGGKIVLENAHTKLLAASILTNGKTLQFEQTPVPDEGKQKGRSRITLTGLPKKCPDDVCGVAVVELRFAEYPR